MSAIERRLEKEKVRRWDAEKQQREELAKQGKKLWDASKAGNN